MAEPDERAPAMAEGAGATSSMAARVVGPVERKSQAKEIGVAGVGVFVERGGISSGKFREGFPRQVFAKSFLSAASAGVISTRLRCAPPPLSKSTAVIVAGSKGARSRSSSGKVATRASISGKSAE